MESKIVTPVLQQTGSVINYRNTWFITFKRGTFNNKQYVNTSAKVIVRAVRGILKRDCANLCTSVKFGTQVVFDMLNPNQPGAEAYF